MDTREYPCGEWIQPAVGKYQAWIEIPGYVSGTPTIVRYGGGPFRGSGSRVVIPVVPAGTLRLDLANSAVAGATTFRVLSLRESPRPFERQLDMSVAAAGVSVPTGRVLAGAFNASGEAIALSQPFEVKNRKVMIVALRPPANGADVLAVLTKPRLQSHSSSGSGTVVLRTRIHHKPDVILDTPTKLFAIWYGVRATRADLLIDDAALPIRTLALSNGRVATVRLA